MFVDDAPSFYSPFTIHYSLFTIHCSSPILSQKNPGRTVQWFISVPVLGQPGKFFNAEGFPATNGVDAGSLQATGHL